VTPKDRTRVPQNLGGCPYVGLFLHHLTYSDQIWHGKPLGKHNLFFGQPLPQHKAWRTAVPDSSGHYQRLHTIWPGTIWWPN